MHSLSPAFSRIASATKKPLLRMLWWLSVAPFGKPVVPLVNWMLIASSNCSVGPMSARAGAVGALGGVLDVREGLAAAVRVVADGDHRLDRGQLPASRSWRTMARYSLVLCFTAITRAGSPPC
jgi:hypothetical protein